MYNARCVMLLGSLTLLLRHLKRFFMRMPIVVGSPSGRFKIDASLLRLMPPSQEELS